jgi:CBS domain-containing protein
VVTDNERVVGVISDHDLQTLTGSSPVAVARDIDKITRLDELVRQHERVDRILEMLLRQGGSAQTMLELVTEFNDRVVKKLIHIIENQMEESGLGSPPVPYVWMALGSEGRREQTLRTDQDNSIIFANVPPEKHDKIQGWFLAFGEQVVDGLERCGIPRCKGGVMANNPKCCQTEETWIKTFISWVRDPNPRTLRLASIFFDFRGIMVEADFLDNLAAKLGKAMEANRLFLRYMAKNGLYNRPPLGFFRQFVVEKSGEHKNKLNLKLSGLTPLVDAARVLSLEQGIKETNTLYR